MSIAARMLRRDLWRLRGQVAAAALVVASGVAAYVTMRSTHAALVAARAEYFGAQRFGDVFCEVVRAPLAVAASIAKLPGVRAVEARVALDARLEIAGFDQPATARVLSLPDRGRPALHDVLVTQGRQPAPGRDDEILVSRTFARAHDLQPGMQLGLLLGDRWRRFTIVGLGLSPEYLYEVPRGALFPDAKRFGVMWLPRRVLAPAADLEGAFNDLVVALEPGASTAAAIAALDRHLTRFGSLGAHDRTDQVSWRFLEDELAEIGVTAGFVPAVFMGVSTLILYVVLARMVALQRGQIGLLKAFGFGDRRVGLHYLAFAAVTVALGMLVGALVGAQLGRGLTALYADYFHFPTLDFRIPPEVLLQALALCGLAALAGSAAALWHAARLPPAEAMRPETPASFRRGALDRVGLTRRLGGAGRMILRHVARRPWRAAATVATIAVATATVALGRFMFDGIETLMDGQFAHLQREDLATQWREPRTAAAWLEIARLPGVLRVEPLREMPVRLRFEHRSRRAALVGLAPGSELRIVPDAAGRPLPLRDDGLVLTRHLAETLGVAPGTRLEVERLDGDRRHTTLTVLALSDEPLGVAGWTTLQGLAKAFGGETVATGALLRVDAAHRDAVQATLRRLPTVVDVSSREAMRAAIRDALDRSFSVMTLTFTGFACVLVFGIVYNNARIALSERSAELASLRVLGFTRREVGTLLLGEQALLTLVALPPGWLLGTGFAALLVAVFERESFRLPFVIEPGAFAGAALVVVAAAVVSGLAVARDVARLDLVAVLKTRT